MIKDHLMTTQLNLGMKLMRKMFSSVWSCRKMMRHLKMIWRTKGWTIFFNKSLPTKLWIWYYKIGTTDCWMNTLQKGMIMLISFNGQLLKNQKNSREFLSLCLCLI
jgi:hypothetical protein